MSGKSLTRRKHTNSKLGCQNCKKKKIRCDENFPQCKNCQKSRKSVCSYLSLSEKEINKIKLAHSIRTSTNKLLSSNYRLPISNQRPPSYFDVLEFKHEMTDLPIRIPNTHYPPLQFKRITTKELQDDEEEEEKVSEATAESPETPTYDTPPTGSLPPAQPVFGTQIPSQTQLPSFGTQTQPQPNYVPQLNAGQPYTPAPQIPRPAVSHFGLNTLPTSLPKLGSKIGPKPGNKLPNGLSMHASFPRSKHHIMVKPYIKVNEYQFTKVSNLDYLLPQIYAQGAHVSVLNDLIVCLGAAVMLTAFQRSPGTSSSASKLSTLCLQLHSDATSKLRRKLTEFDSVSDAFSQNAQTDRYVTKYTPVLYYGHLFLSYASLLLGLSMENFSKTNSTGIHVMQRFLKYNRGRPTTALIQTILNTYQYQMLFIHIPSYNPEYLGEVTENLHSLAKTYMSLDETDQKLAAVKKLYTDLVSFVHDQYLPIVQNTSLKDKNSVISYPADALYNLLKSWCKVFPSAAFVPISFNKTQDALYVSDLSSTLYCYYYLIGASLRTTFPFMTYMFGVNFTTLSLNASKSFFEISSVVNAKLNDDVQGFLQRHNYYALRVYSFFRHRARIYIRNTDWSPNYFIPQLQSSRTFPNVHEAPIKSFAYTLIRPEHYPSVSTRSDSPGHKFNRTDETMILKLYARNIETLKFFDTSYVLQFDYSSMALLRDYRPVSAQCETNFDPLSHVDLEFYKNDRSYILDTFRSQKN